MPKPRKTGKASKKSQWSDMGGYRPGHPSHIAAWSAMRDAWLTIIMGPAGTGKTFLAIGHAISLFRAGTIEHITLCRPNVEHGPSLGFGKGSYAAKMQPWVAPLTDAIKEQTPDVIPMSVVPLSHMRGRTWRGMAILDEAQNCTAATLKLFASRCGRDSRIIICGDDAQCDLPGGSVLGAMADAATGSRGVAVVRLPAAAQMRRPELVDLMDRWAAY